MPPGLQAFLQEISAYQFILWIVAGIALIGFLWKVWPAIKKVVKTIETLETLPEDMTDVKAELKIVKHELFPNSGNSLRDKVDQIGTKLTHTDTKVTAAILWQEQHKEEADVAFEKIDVLWEGRKEDG